MWRGVAPCAGTARNGSAAREISEPKDEERTNAPVRSFSCRVVCVRLPSKGTDTFVSSAE